MELTKYQAARFQAFTDEVIRIEGGYVNDPDDPGGETKYGITKRLAVSLGYRKRMIDMTKDEAKELYRLSFWNDSLASNIMNDAAFNIYLLFSVSITCTLNYSPSFLSRHITPFFP